MWLIRVNLFGLQEISDCLARFQITLIWFHKLLVLLFLSVQIVCKFHDATTFMDFLLVVSDLVIGLFIDLLFFGGRIGPLNVYIWLVSNLSYLFLDLVSIIFF